MSTPEISPAPKYDPEIRARAKAILEPWWEDQVPRPTMNYPGAIKVLERALRAGWPDDDLRQALDEIPAISGGCLQFWWNRHKKARPAAKVSPARTIRIMAIEHDADLVLRGVLSYNECGPEVRALVDSKLGQDRHLRAIDAVAS